SPIFPAFFPALREKRGRDGFAFDCVISHTPPRHSLVFSVFVLAEIVPRIERVSAPVNATNPARDAKGGVVGRERAPCLSRPFSSCRMSNVWSGFGGRFRRRNRGTGAVPASHAAGPCSAARAGSALPRSDAVPQEERE